MQLVQGNSGGITRTVGPLEGRGYQYEHVTKTEKIHVLNNMFSMRLHARAQNTAFSPERACRPPLGAGYACG